MNSVLAYSPEIYGGYARFTATADFLELSALRKPKSQVRQADLARRIEKDELKLSHAMSVEVGDASQAAAIVFEILELRARTLGKRYPFSLTAKDGLAARRATVGAYRLLLALATAHAYEVRTQDPKKLFEHWVAKVMVALGLRSVVTGTARHRPGGGFPAMVAAASSEIGLSATPDAAVISNSSQDEKVDALAHLDLGDSRPGRWIFIGQATLARSTDWERKMAEPKGKLWRTILNESLDPAPFLAVPHHVETRHLEHLHNSVDAIVLDRLRLARTDVPLTAAERALVTTVDKCAVEW